MEIITSILFFLICSACSAASFGGLTQTNYFAASSSVVDVLSLSNSVPAGATLVVFETFEAPTGMASGAVTNSSNYTANLIGTQVDSSVHRQTVYTIYCTNGFTAGANVGMGYTGAINSARAYTLAYFIGLGLTQPNAVNINGSFGTVLTFAVTNRTANGMIFGMSTTDGPPTDNNGSNLHFSSSMNLIAYSTNIGFSLAGGTAGLVSASYYQAAPTPGVYTNVDTWTSTNSQNKADEWIFVAANPIATTSYLHITGK